MCDGAHISVEFRLARRDAIHRNGVVTATKIISSWITRTDFISSESLAIYEAKLSGRSYIFIPADGLA